MDALFSRSRHVSETSTCYSWWEATAQELQVNRCLKFMPYKHSMQPLIISGSVCFPLKLLYGTCRISATSFSKRSRLCGRGIWAAWMVLDAEISFKNFGWKAHKVMISYRHPSIPIMFFATFTKNGSKVQSQELCTSGPKNKIWKDNQRYFQIALNSTDMFGTALRDMT